MSKLYSFLIQRRTIRKFKQKKIPKSILNKIVNSARLAPSAANFQILEYLVVDNPSLCRSIFLHTKWAGFLKGKGTPSETQKPVVYIVILINKDRSQNPDLRDVGASAQNMLLSALSFGLGSCWLGAINKEAIVDILKVPSLYQIDSLVALGYPQQRSRVIDSDTTIKYSQNRQGNMTVPKRPLKKILHYNRI